MTQKTLVLFVFPILFYSFGLNITSVKAEEKICQKKITGIFTGTFPCLDCPGIKVTLILKDDDTYNLSIVYIEKNIAPISECGTVHTTNRKKTLLLKSSNHNNTIVRIRKNGIELLESDINGFNLSENKTYYLHLEQSAPPISDSRQLSTNKWLLTELPAISLSWNHTSDQSPYIKFNTKDKQIYGFAGCNTFFGKYKLGVNNRIQFFDITNTKKYCMNTMAIENAFLDMLGRCQYFAIDNASLIFLDQNQKTISSFKKQ